MLLGRHRFGEDDQARGFPIQPVNDEEPGRARVAARDPVAKKPVGRALALALGGDGQEAGGLVDHEDVVVLVDESQGRRARGRRG